MGQMGWAAGGRGGDSAAVKAATGCFSPALRGLSTDVDRPPGPVGRVAMGAAGWREGFGHGH